MTELRFSVPLNKSISFWTNRHPFTLIQTTL